MRTEYTNHQNYNIHKCTTVFSVVALMVIVSILGFQNAVAQTTVTVEPDNYPMSIGNLNRAIEEHGGDVIYLLENGASYFVNSELRFNHPLRLQAADYPENTDNPPIVRPGVGEVDSPNLMRNEGNTESYNIFWYGIDDLGDYRNNQQPYGEGAYHYYKDCIIMGGVNYMWRIEAAGMTIRVEDSHIFNTGRHTTFSNQHMIDSRRNDIDSLIFINNSIYQFAARLINPREALIDYVEFNHNTIVNQANSYLVGLGYTKELVFTNNLLQNTNMYGRWEAIDVAGEDGHRYMGPDYLLVTRGLIDVSLYEEIFDPEDPNALTDADRNFVIRNNNFGGLPDEIILDMWAEFSDPANYPSKLGEDPEAPSNLWVTDPRWRWANPDIGSGDPGWAERDTVQRILVRVPPMDSVLTAWANNNEPQITYENNIDERVQLNDPPDIVAFRDWLVEHWWDGSYTLNNLDRMDVITEHGDPFSPNYRAFHPAPGKPAETSDVTTAWVRNLGYTSDSPSFYAAENNYPLGNLNYYPELKEAWEQGIVQTSIRDEELANDFKLIGNYPNPFNPTTNIVYELAYPTEVNMKIFNILGQTIESMQLGLQAQGRHEITFDASNLSSGIYLVRMSMGSEVHTHRMMLLK